MRTKVIQIGNSRGIRIPKALLQQSGLTGEVQLEVQWQKIIIRPARKARQGWAEALRAMAQNDADQLFDKQSTISPSSWDETEWVW